VQLLDLPRSVLRAPLWGLGCVGGAAALLRSMVLARGLQRPVLAIACELCSLTFVHGDRRKANVIAVAQRVRLKVNPINGLPQVEEVATATAPPAVPPPAAAPALEPLLPRLGHLLNDLVATLGIPEEIAEAAMRAPDDDAILALAEAHEGWVGSILVDLAAGDPAATIADRIVMLGPKLITSGTVGPARPRWVAATSIRCRKP
jgi:hypothetical protein